MRPETMKRVSILIPCYNEEGNIGECLRQIPDMPWETEIIVIDDGSVDKTAEIARQNSKLGLKVIRYEQNMGKGAALRVGLQSAAGDIAVILDADYTSPPSEIPLLVKPIIDGKADFVTGTRFTYPMEKDAMKGLHVLSNKVTALIISLFMGQQITDSLCGLKAFRREMLAGEPRENGWPDFELLLKAKRNNMRIMEVPIHYMSRKAGVSKMNTLRESYKMPVLLIKTLFRIQ